MEIQKYYDANNIYIGEGHIQQCELQMSVMKTLIQSNNVKNIMEIGFGAGHSAEFFLSINNNIKLTSFDIGINSYTKLGKEFLEKKYLERFKLIIGDSLITVPEFYEKNKNIKFDLIFIDGGHNNNIPNADLINCKNLSHKNTIVIMDDVINKKEWQRPWNVEPTNGWYGLVEKNFILEYGYYTFLSFDGKLHCSTYGKYNLNICSCETCILTFENKNNNNNLGLCEIFVLTLDRDDRKYIFEKNKIKFPNIKKIISVNGYNKKETVDELIKLKLKYYKLETGFCTYGTLANFITKVKMLKYQIENNIPYICFIEDDLVLDDNFEEFINSYTSFFHKDINMIRLATWGEGYITSIESAKRVLNCIYDKGIINNIDGQLKYYSGSEIYLHNTPWKLVIGTNNGDCLKTERLESDFAEKMAKLY